MFHGLCFTVCTHSILMNIPFHPSIRFWPFPVGLVRLPTEKAPGKGCQNLVPDIHPQSDHQPSTLQNMAGEFVKHCSVGTKSHIQYFFLQTSFFWQQVQTNIFKFYFWISYHVSFDLATI